MKTIIILLAFTLTFVSCSQKKSDTNELLTSSSWVIDPAITESGTASNKSEIIKFMKDGTYSLEAGGLKVNGKWSWKSENEIYLIIDGLTSDNGAAKFDKTSNYNIRVLEISNTTLRILEKGENDSWDSGVAKEKKYAAKK
jgi:hypothetical protein